MEDLLSEKDPALKTSASKAEWSVLEDLTCPGLTEESAEIKSLKSNIPATFSVFSYKRARQESWVVFIGGTGTGKSTLFNGLCGGSFSETGVERPKTTGPVAYAHKDCPIGEDLPLGSIQVFREAMEVIPPKPASGLPGHLLVLSHEKKEWRNVIFVDTPDLDSVELENRRITADLLRLSDVAVFVSSEEKYADEVPNAVLGRILEMKKPCFFLLNKTRDLSTKEDVTQTLDGFGISLEKLWLIPYFPSPQPERIRKDRSFADFQVRLFSAISGEHFRPLREKELSSLLNEVQQDTGRILYLLHQEEQAAHRWLASVANIYESVSTELTEGIKRQYTEENRQYLAEKVRSLFSRYDLLARPRKLLREIILSPFRMLGLFRETRAGFSKETLRKVRNKVEYGPVIRAMEKFHIRVLRELSPSDRSAPLYAALRDEDLPLNEEQIRHSLNQGIERLELWLEATFEDLARGLPAAKKWSIYSTSILWGILIIALETAAGGGFSILDAAMDSALAPFVTRGAVEVFAAQEIRKIARELGERYRQVLIGPLREQQERYVYCLRSLLAPPEAIANMETLQTRISGSLTS